MNTKIKIIPENYTIISTSLYGFNRPLEYPQSTLIILGINLNQEKTKQIKRGEEGSSSEARVEARERRKETYAFGERNEVLGLMLVGGGRKLRACAAMAATTLVSKGLDQW